MSIARDTFENTSEEELADLSVPDRVPQTGLAEGAVSTALSWLKDRGLVEHKATYWAVTDDEDRLAGYSSYEWATALFNAQLGAEDRDAWRERAHDDPHPGGENDH